MAKALVVFYSRTGTTEEMAKVIGASLADQGLDVAVKSVAETRADDFLDYDAIVAGSPTYYGLMAAELKALFDESVKHHGKLAGKVGAAFTSAANVGGGNETTVLSILQAMLIHGMVVKGSARGDHYGPVAIGKVDKRARVQCEKLAREVAELTKMVAANG